MAGIQNKLLTGTMIVIHSEKAVSVVKITGNINETWRQLITNPNKNNHKQKNAKKKKNKDKKVYSSGPSTTTNNFHHT